jgi:uncharacterized protein (DUF849 family)
MASLNMGSANVGEGVYVNTLPDIRFWADRMRERRIVPELEVFEGGMLSNIPRLVEERVLVPPFHVNFCLGFEGPLPADPNESIFSETDVTPGSALGCASRWHAGFYPAGNRHWAARNISEGRF